MSEGEFDLWRREHASKKRRWRENVTFVTPAKKLEWFVSQLVASFEHFEQAGHLITQIVFDPENLDALRAKHGFDESIYETPAHHVTTISDLEELLIATFYDCVDFKLLLVPGQFAMFADHDYFCSIFAMTKSDLNRVIRRIEDGVDFVEWWAPANP